MIYASAGILALLLNAILNWKILSEVRFRSNPADQRRRVINRYGWFLIAANCFFISDILWGILHLLAFCMLIQGLGDWLGERAEAAKRPNLATALFSVGILCLLLGFSLWLRQSRAGGGLLPRFADFILGVHPEYFYSADYFPILPWFFVFEAGTLLGKPIREGRFPRWFYEAKMPFFSRVGKHSLLIYILHQPILYGIVMGIAWMKGH